MENQVREALFAQAARREAAKNEKKLFDFPGVGKLEFVKLNDEKMLDLYSDMMDSQNSRELPVILSGLIYDCCPALHDKELLDALGIFSPPDVVFKLMNLKQVNVLGTQILTWNGIGLDDNSFEDTVKN